MQSECKVDANSKPWLDSGKTVLLQRVSSLEVKPNKKVKLMKRVMLVMAVALMSALQVSAQNGRNSESHPSSLGNGRVVTDKDKVNVKIDDKELVGVWLMESMQWEGEKKTVCGKQTGYTQFKYYGADGEYACAEIAMTKDGKCVVMPHEYGTYTFKDGWYSEMGREAIKDAIVWVDKTTTKGTWQKRHDIWKKQLNMPEKLRKYIVDCCKTKNAPDDIQQMIKQTMFK